MLVKFPSFTPKLRFCFAQAKTSGNPAGVVQQRVKRLALQYIGESHMWLAIYIMNHHDRLSTKN